MSDAAISPTTELRPPNADTLTELEHIVGGQHAVRDPDRMAPYLTEWRDRYRGEAAIVLKPGSTNEVAAVLKCANAARAGIVPQGGNTGLVGAQIPDESGSQIVLSLERLVHIRDVDLASNTMTVEAGLTLAGAQERAMSVGRLFPLSLASEGSCQIGGVLSTNAGGLAVLAYGNARDLALGLEVVLADGRVWHGLKALRKDNTGYDLKNLFIGAEGTLGVITAAVLRLFPRPAEQVTCLAGLRDLETRSSFWPACARRRGPCSPPSRFSRASASTSRSSTERTCTTRSGRPTPGMSFSRSPARSPARRCMNLCRRSSATPSKSGSSKTPF